MGRKNQVYEYLLNEILSNRLPPGAPIIEMEIATALHTSRTPVREALKTLESDGLVCHYPSRGTIVSEITPYDVEEIFHLRAMLEIYALQVAYDKLTADELNRVEKMFLSLDDASPWQDYHIADKTLHALIIDKAGNSRLKQFLSILNVQIERFRRLAALDPARAARSRSEHLEIIKALQRKDLQASEESLRQHLVCVKNSTLEIVKLSLMDKIPEYGTTMELF
jgi:Transcriptional regulators